MISSVFFFILISFIFLYFISICYCFKISSSYSPKIIPENDKNIYNYYSGLDNYNQLIKILKNEKIGLITNPSGVSYKNYESSIDILYKYSTQKSPPFHLECLFAPEHGIRGNKKPGAYFDDYIDPITNLKVFSIYKKGVHSPTKQMLQNVTTLVIDIQDVGSRTYTYISTLANCMKDLKNLNKSIKFVVLDRLNPIGSEEDDVQGPILDLKHKSFVGIWKIPLKHGMTIGELALLFNYEMNLNINLHIVKFDVQTQTQTQQSSKNGLTSMNYYRKPGFFYSNFFWIPPSPNLPNLRPTILYPGLVFFESFHNLSLGRGTTTPFQVFGAPFVEPYKVLELIKKEREKNQIVDQYFKGLVLTPTFFIPTSSYHKDKECKGIRIMIIDKQKVSKYPIELSLTLLKVFLNLYGEEKLLFKREWFILLTGNEFIIDNLLNGMPIPDIVKLWEKDLNQFKIKRKKYLLY